MMKYGESAFDIIYLVTAIVVGVLILKKAGNKTERSMGIAVLLLGCGDAFHLVPRVLNYFIDRDFTAALGVGKMITSITMTVFYVLVFRIGCTYDRMGEHKPLLPAVYAMAGIRIVLCLLPQNRWLTNDGDVLWAVLRNAPFIILGMLTVFVYYRNRLRSRYFRYVWLWILLSFAFYIPVAIAAGVFPPLGMLMLPKTVCYLVLIFTFLKVVTVFGSIKTIDTGKKIMSKP